MKKYGLILCILLSFAKAIEAQTDLNYFINAAKQNSPLILDNKNQSKANQLEAQRLKAFYTKPQIGITANYLFSPIINLDNNTAKFEANSSGGNPAVTAPT